MVVAGAPHHVTQRGNRREDVFFSDDDRQRFLQLFLDYSRNHGLSTLAYCLMTNHVHFVCIPARPESLADTFKPVNLRYAQHVNWTQDLSGRLWQGRFFSCVLDGPHLWSAIRYVERNPVRARLVRKGENYPWSSAAAHCGLRSDPLLTPLPKGLAVRPDQWSEYLAEGDLPDEIERLRVCTRTGRPAAEESFVKRLERSLGRPLLAKPVGRPKKETDNENQ